MPKFDCYSEPATLGPRWTRWLTAFELYADGKGLILEDNASASVKQRRRALLLHHAGTDVQDIFAVLPATGGPTEYVAAVAALNAYFVPQVNTAFARQSFYQTTQKPGEPNQRCSAEQVHVGLCEEKVAGGSQPDAGPRSGDSGAV